ncbi:MAG: hypothetical protein KDA57_07515 [Planctomycetales bacterium]|nr:hypothetical protein [Planctomycetales bacterium]
MAAIGGAYYRRCSPEAQTYLLFYWGSTLAGLVWFFWSQERQRLKTCAEAGECLIRLPRIHYSFRIAAGFFSWGGAAMLFWAIATFLHNTLNCELLAKKHPSFLTPTGAGALSSFYLLVAVFAIRAGRDVRLCENGVLSAQRFIQWRDIRSIRPNLGTDHDDRTVYSLKGNPAFRVPSELREAVDTLLQSHGVS